mmetsp:Transcript_99571/g.286018  ORF Transcript_99571/g.286018 Transcript_99571/m.286018 type:complete len:283 (+) Transcript_99571:390-1238(+)
MPHGPGAILQELHRVEIVYAVTSECRGPKVHDAGDDGRPLAHIRAHHGFDHALEPGERGGVQPSAGNALVQAKRDGRTEGAFGEAHNSDLVVGGRPSEEAVRILHCVVPCAEEVHRVVVRPREDAGVVGGTRQPKVPHTRREAAEAHRPQQETSGLHATMVVVRSEAMQRDDSRLALRQHPRPRLGGQPPCADVDGRLAFWSRARGEKHELIAELLSLGLPVKNVLGAEARLHALVELLVRLVAGLATGALHVPREFKGRDVRVLRVFLVPSHAHEVPTHNC